MDSNDYDCPQYVDFASDDFLTWRATASPSVHHYAGHASLECCDSMVFRRVGEENGSDVSIAEENTDLRDALESFKTAEIQTPCQNLRSNALESGSLTEDSSSSPGGDHFAQHNTSENSKILESLSSCGNISNVSSSDASMSGSLREDTGFSLGEHFAQHENSEMSENHSSHGNGVLSWSPTSDMTKQETPHDFPLHHTNFRASEDDQRKKILKEAVPKSFHLKNKNCTSKPFHIGEQQKLKKEALNALKSKKCKSGSYIPLAEQVAAFQKQTPKRFHTRKDFEPAKYWCPPKVIPQSPNLCAAKRHRTINVLSTEEKEKFELEENQNHRFRAKPLNAKVFGQPQLPKVTSKPSTNPENINFNTAQRAAEQFKKKKQKEPKYVFRARPVPSFVPKKLKQVKSEKEKHTTIPVSPCFALKSREEKWSSLAEKTKEIPKTKSYKSHPPPKNVPFTIKHEIKSTEVQPFSFDSKDKERYALKKQKIEEEIEKENMIPPFKAQPVPYLQNCDSSVKQSSLNPSESEPCFQFKAQPAAVLKKPPFMPEKPAKQLLEIKEFNLHTDIRASERQQMKEQKQIEEEEKRRALLLLRQEEEEQQKREILKLRQEMVHKANPIKHYKCVEIQPSSMPLTEPQTPKFATKERLTSKHQ